LHEEGERAGLDLRRASRAVLVELELALAEARQGVEVVLGRLRAGAPRVVDRSLLEGDRALSLRRLDEELAGLPREVEEVDDLGEAHLLEVAGERGARRRRRESLRDPAPEAEALRLGERPRPEGRLPVLGLGVREALRVVGVLGRVAVVAELDDGRPEAEE